jgi:sugar lactone lactonase YvrE
MKRSITLAAIGLAVFSLQFITPDPKKTVPTLTRKWETDSILKVPESVLVDEKRNTLYVSNIDGKPQEKDGRGFISTLTLEGKIKDLEWVSGLSAPKGMGLYKNRLFVTDLTDLVIIDIEKGKIEQRIPVEGATLMNDITVAPNGTVYISDSGGKKVFKYENGKASLFFDGTSELTKPNGLFATAEVLYLVDMGTGVFYSLDYKTPKLVKKAEGATLGDGIVSIGKDEFLISNWDGEINYISTTGTPTQKLLDTKAQKKSCADIDYNQKTKTLYIPTFWKNSLVAYKLK